MPTLFSFGRAVKAHAQSLVVCAPMLLGGCVSHAVEHLSAGPPTGPVRAAPTGTPPQPAAQTATQTTLNQPSPVATPDAPSAGDTAALHAATELSFEQPYPADARPRAASQAQALADDEELARWNAGGTDDPNYPSSQAAFHPGTRVVVDAYFAGRAGGKSRATGRGFSAERVQALARSKGYWPFRLCFEAGQREQKGLGGETRVRFTISARGTVSAARLVASELRNRASSACLVTELRKLRFTPPPAKHVEVVASIRIWPGDADLPPLSDSPPQPIDTGSGFDPAAVRVRVANRQAELATCFSEARRSDPSLWGRLALAVVLEVDGTVHRVSEVESHFPNAAAARCAAAALSTILFPSVSGKPFSFVLAMRLAPSSERPHPEAGGLDVAAPAASPESEDGGTQD
jgi:hypothetical protein